MSRLDIKFTTEDVDEVLIDVNDYLKVDKVELLNRINTQGPLETSIFYGSMHHSYRYHQIAGRIGYKAILKDLTSDINSYITRINKFMRPEVRDYILDNVRFFQEIVTMYDKKMSMEFDYLQFMSHYSTYLVRDRHDGKVIETPALMHLRVAAECFYRDESPDHTTVGEANVFLISSLEHYFSMASPVLFNSGLKEYNLSSCFLMTPDDDIESIADHIKRIMLVSKVKGAVGIDLSALRHSDIGQGGMSKGIVPFLIQLDATVKYVDQNGKRSGACTAFLQAHHIDILEFIEVRRKTTAANQHVDSLNTAIVFPSLFWKRFQKGEDWTIFCPHLFPGLNESFGEDYDNKYLEYESMQLSPEIAPYRKSIKSTTLMKMMCELQILSGMPYVIHKDNINYKSNRVNLDSDNPCHRRIIGSSNLCLEIYEQSSNDEVACCNLGQMSLPKYVTSDGEFNFDLFGFMVRKVTGYLDRIIDNSKYPCREARKSNSRHRPIGLGVSGYADALHMMKIPYESKEAEVMNKKIFACMYFNSLVESLSLAISNGAYETFDGSPLSNGKFQFDLWKDEYEKVKDQAGSVRNPIDDEPIDPLEWGQKTVNVRYEPQLVVDPSWDSLRQLIILFGVRNCQRTAIMPSASTSRLMSNTECIEAHQECIYVRNFGQKSMVVIDRHLQFALEKIGLWSEEVAEFIVADYGSIQKLPTFLENDSQELKQICEIYKTMFEIKQMVSFTHTSHRHRYIDQGISANVYFRRPTIAMLTNFHLFTWMSGINTGMYYLRSDPGGDVSNFSAASKKVRDFISARSSAASGIVITPDVVKETLACQRNAAGCVSCSS